MSALQSEPRSAKLARAEANIEPTTEDVTSGCGSTATSEDRFVPILVDLIVFTRELTRSGSSGHDPIRETTRKGVLERDGLTP